MALVDAWLAGPAAHGGVATWAANTLAIDRPQLALRWVERAVELEYGRPGGPVNVAVLQATFGDLFARYERVVDAARTLEVAPPPDLDARIVRAADRWRALAPDPSEACTRAAWSLRALGRDDLAWEYLVSPLALDPVNAERWAGLARALVAQGAVALADSAWAQACEVEPTNAGYLWERADVLRREGRAAAARPLLERLAAGPWQPRFDHYRVWASAALSEAR